MRIVLITSVQPGAGKTTVAVNVACGLARRGYPTALVDLGRGQAAKLWLDKVAPDPDLLVYAGEELNQVNLEEPERQFAGEFIIVDLELTHPAAPGLLPKADLIWVVAHPGGSSLDFATLHELDEHVRIARGSGVDQCIPAQINLREWENNDRNLMALLEFYGEDRIASPVPS